MKRSCFSADCSNHKRQIRKRPNSKTKKRRCWSKSWTCPWRKWRLSKRSKSRMKYRCRLLWKRRRSRQRIKSCWTRKTRNWISWKHNWKTQSKMKRSNSKPRKTKSFKRNTKTWSKLWRTLKLKSQMTRQHQHNRSSRRPHSLPMRPSTTGNRNLRTTNKSWPQPVKRGWWAFTPSQTKRKSSTRKYKSKDKSNLTSSCSKWKRGKRRGQRRKKHRAKETQMTQSPTLRISTMASAPTSSANLGRTKCWTRRSWANSK